MAAEETVNLNLRADLTQLRSELAKVPGITEAEAKKMVSALNAQLKRAESASKKAAATMKREFDARLSSIKKGASTVFGGIVGDIEDVTGALKAMGPAGGTAAVGGVAALGAIAASAKLAYEEVQFVVAAAYELAEADERIARMEGLENFHRASKEALDASRDLNAATDALAAQMDDLYVVTGERAAPALAELARAAIALTEVGRDWYDNEAKRYDITVDLLTKYHEMTGTLYLVEAATNAVASATSSYTDRADALLGRVQQLNREEEERKRALEMHQLVLDRQKKGEEERAAAERAAEKAARDAARAAGEAERARERAAQAREKAAKEAVEADLWMAQIGEELGDEMLKNDERVVKERMDLEKSLREFKDQQLAADKAALDQADADELDRLAERRRAVEDTYNLMAGAAYEFTDALIAAGEGGTEAQKKAALVAFNVQKALTIAQLTVDAVRATSNTLASVPGPAGVIAATAIAGTYAALAAKAATAKPPEFHTGGEVSATLLDGEHVMNRRAARNNREALEEMNRTGELPQQGGQMAYVVIGGRIPDDITSRGLRGPRSQKRIEDMSRTGRTRVYR